MKKLLTAFAAAIGLVSATAQAQVVQPMYVRPSKGAAITVLNVDAPTGAGTIYTPAPILDWTAFAGVAVTLNAPTNCRYGIRVKALGGTNTTRAEYFLLNTPGASYAARSSQAWYVRVLSGYLSFDFESYDGGATGLPACTGKFKIVVTPVPFDYSNPLSNAGNTDWLDTIGSAAVFITVPSQTPRLRIQSTDTSVTFCTLPANIADPLVQWPIQLKAASGSGTGDGGVFELGNWTGQLVCYGKFAYLTY